MKVQYERLFNLGNYENEKIIVEDEVRPGETPGETYTRLRAELFAMAGRADPRAPKPAPAPAPIFQPQPDHGHHLQPTPAPARPPPGAGARVRVLPCTPPY